jgi:hypothetical protein
MYSTARNRNNILQISNDEITIWNFNSPITALDGALHPMGGTRGLSHADGGKKL